MTRSRLSTDASGRETGVRDLSMSASFDRTSRSSAFVGFELGVSLPAPSPLGNMETSNEL